jgi:uncharacterized membrane protein YdbT with pleckstrin-like domain
MELLHGERVIWRGRPSPRASLAVVARWGTASLIPAVLATVLSVKGAPTVLALGDWWVISIVLVLLVAVRTTLVRHSRRFTVTNLRISVRHGFVARTEQTAAIARIQNVTTRQTIVQRMLGIGDVEFDTAGEQLAHADFRFAGIADPNAVVRRIDFGWHGAPRDSWTVGCSPESVNKL